MISLQGKCMPELTLNALENWLWEAACVVRGPLDAPKFKDYILPLVFLKRLSDVFDDEVGRLAREIESSRERALKLAHGDHKVVWFFIPEEARWDAVSRKTTDVGEYLTDAVRAVARENPKLQGVIDVRDFNETAAGQRMVDDGRLIQLVQVLGRHRLGLDDVEPDILGRAYEYLLRKFAEGQGQSAGEFYTPREVSVLMAKLLAPEPGMTIYDPCCGSGGLLIKAHLELMLTRGQKKDGRRILPPDVAPLRLFGQEINPSTFAMSRMNAFVHRMEAEIALGDTMHRPAFLTGDGRLQTFDLVTANPMWNQKFDAAATYEHDTYERFGLGIPPGSSADWGWIQHMAASLSSGGRMALVIDTGAVSRGSGNRGSNRERDIRKAFVERDWIEAVILLPENLFYNTTAPAVILVLNRKKRRANEILLINASKLFSKGRPKNYLEEEHVGQVSTLYADWKAAEGLSAIILREQVVESDYNLSPSRYVVVDNEEEVLPLEEAVVLLREAEEERAEADRKLNEVLKELGLGPIHGDVE